MQTQVVGYDPTMVDTTPGAGTPSEELREEDGVMCTPDGLKYLTPTRARAFLGLVRTGDRLARDLSATLERSHGISLHAFEVLLHLAVFSGDGQRRMADLIEQTPLSQSRVSRLVADLERHGLVERSQLDADRREVVVTITPAGVELFRQAQETHLADLEARFFCRLSPEELRQLTELTNRIFDPRG